MLTSRRTFRYDEREDINSSNLVESVKNSASVNFNERMQSLIPAIKSYLTLMGKSRSMENNQSNKALKPFKSAEKIHFNHIGGSGKCLLELCRLHGMSLKKIAEQLSHRDPSISIDMNYKCLVRFKNMLEGELSINN